MKTAEQLDRFYHFAAARIRDRDDDPSFDKLVEEWQARRSDPGPNLSTADIAAIREALEDFDAGEPGRNARGVARELFAKHGITPE